MAYDAGRAAEPEGGEDSGPGGKTLERDEDAKKAEPGAGFDSLKAGSTDTSAIEAYYDDWAASYDRNLNEWNYKAPREAAAMLREKLDPGPHVPDVLDVGCGTGMFAGALSALMDCRVEGVDISAASLEIAGKSGNYDRLHRHDLQSIPLPFGDNAVDAAACVGVLTYIEDAAGLLADICRIVRPGGYFAFTQRDDRWAGKNFDALVADFAGRGLWTPVHVSDAVPYLPKNDDFGDAIKVVHVLCRIP